MLRLMHIDLNPNEIFYYPFIISMSWCNGSCNTTEYPVGRKCVPNQLEDMNLKVFHITKGINESKNLPNPISCECRCEFDVTKRNSR